jgi:pyruvate,water dikinase
MFMKSIVAHSPMIHFFHELRLHDIAKVGGKNASLGEMICHLTELGIQVPTGFATSSDAFHCFLETNQLTEKIKQALANFDSNDLRALAEVGARIRAWILNATMPPILVEAITQAFHQLWSNTKNLSFAVRSSATAEDLPDASFAGQQETFLNVTGIDNIIQSVKKVYASLYQDRAISYRIHQGYENQAIGISAGIQQMVRSDCGVSGVMFSLDTESGFEDVVFITAAYGLGEMVVQGAINPDEYCVYKPALRAKKKAIISKRLGLKQQQMIYAEAGSTSSVKTIAVDSKKRQLFALTDLEITQLAQHALTIETHYGRHMDIEWAKDGVDGKLYILQARPETVKSQSNANQMERYQLKSTGNILVTGRSIGQKIGQGPAKLITSLKEIDKIEAGDVLVTDMTDPDWEPIMKKASAIVTNRGGRTCHAAIIARELGIPAVVGCVDATQKIKANELITVSCAEGEVGTVYQGALAFERKIIHLDTMPEIPFKIMMNVGNPERAFDCQRLPNHGVGLARLEFIISQHIGIHPQACLSPHTLPPAVQEEIHAKTIAYGKPRDYYIDKLSEGISTIAAAFAPNRVIIRMSDFKSNEYANLLGGAQFEPKEENPMLGFRGAARYVSNTFKAAFALECEAVKRVREEMGLAHVEIMIPFVRTPTEAKAVMAVLEEFGLKRGQNGLKIQMMCELPTNALLADAYLEYFDGFSIGSNDLTQLTLGLDRDSALVASQFDERDLAVKALLKQAIVACKAQGKYIGICGQGPSDHLDFAKWLIEQGIDSVSLNPDTVIATWLYLAEHLR